MYPVSKKAYIDDDPLCRIFDIINKTIQRVPKSKYINRVCYEKGRDGYIVGTPLCCYNNIFESVSYNQFTNMDDIVIRSYEDSDVYKMSDFAYNNTATPTKELYRGFNNMYAASERTRFMESMHPDNKYVYNELWR